MSQQPKQEEEAVVQVLAVSLTNSSVYAVAVDVLVLRGRVTAGMYLQVPMNRNFTVSLSIGKTVPQSGDAVRLLLDCGADPEAADLILAFDIAGETLRVTPITPTLTEDQ